MSRKQLRALLAHLQQLAQDPNINAQDQHSFGVLADTIQALIDSKSQ
jgi:hypothetical protein